MTAPLACLLLVATAAMASEPAGPPPPAPAAVEAPDPPPCETWARPPEKVGATPAALRELSGLVASRRHPGVYWGHNDSDNRFELVALRADGTVVATFPIDGQSALDVEDIARGPCIAAAARTCIFLADVGDNLEVRPNVQLFEVPEPAVLADGPLAAHRLPFRYADGAHNAEALLVDAAGRIWVVTKRLDDLGRVYRVEGLGAGRIGAASFVRRLRAPSGFGALTTGGDVHPSGTRVVLRTYTTAWEYRGAPGEDVATMLAHTPVEVPAPRQPQSEAITYTADGREIVMGSEKTGAPIYRVHCAAPQS